MLSANKEQILPDSEYSKPSLFRAPPCSYHESGTVPRKANGDPPSSLTLLHPPTQKGGITGKLNCRVLFRLNCVFPQNN